MKRKDDQFDMQKRKKEIISVQNNSDIDSQDSDSETEQLGRKALLKVKGKKSQGPVKNKQRVLLVPSRGIVPRFRYLLKDINALLPHSKKDVKLGSKAGLNELNELAELNNCNNCMYFESRNRQDSYMWMAKTPLGPSAKFMVNNSNENVNKFILWTN
jgi:ribosome biogenesis protein BRX1